MGNEESVGPESISLGSFGTDAEKVLEGLSSLLNFASTYGAFVPGLSGYIPAITEVNKIIRGAEALFKA